MNFSEPCKIYRLTNQLAVLGQRLLLICRSVSFAIIKKCLILLLNRNGLSAVYLSVSKARRKIVAVLCPMHVKLKGLWFHVWELLEFLVGLSVTL